MKDIFWFGLEDLRSSKHFEGLKEAYMYLETYLGESKYVASDEISIADFSVVATLSTLDLIMPVEKEDFPKLTAWYAKMKELPYYETANQRGLDDLKEKLMKKSKFIFES
jgi:glutathione S-transferase